VNHESFTPCEIRPTAVAARGGDAPAGAAGRRGCGAVHAAAVTPTELLWYPTLHTKEGNPRSAPVLGHEFSGDIAECGEGVRDLAIGKDVYGMNDWFAEGALAEYCVTRPEWIASKPRGLSYEQAASVPISALTAWQGLFERGRLQPAERVLIHGGAGAVGMFAVQLAHMYGAQVITTVSATTSPLRDH
jgi:NADPH:quinone reductase-like Zn-dependent oxidoreductase